jgi:hypothetical protein
MKLKRGGGRTRTGGLRVMGPTRYQLLHPATYEVVLRERYTGDHGVDSSYQKYPGSIHTARAAVQILTVCRSGQGVSQMNFPNVLPSRWTSDEGRTGVDT